MAQLNRWKAPDKRCEQNHNDKISAVVVVVLAEL